MRRRVRILLQYAMDHVNVEDTTFYNNSCGLDGGTIAIITAVTIDLINVTAELGHSMAGAVCGAADRQAGRFGLGNGCMMHSL